MEQNKIKKLIFGIFTLLMFVVLVTPQSQVYAASKNQKAHKAYMKKIKAIAGGACWVSYKYVDLTGDGVHEVIIEYQPYGHGCNENYRIYTYRKGKAVCVLNDSFYGVDKIIYYKKTDSLIFYCYGHGGEHYDYYKMRNKKYTYVASRGHRSIKGGNDVDWPWVYGQANSWDPISYDQFCRLVNPLMKGTKKSVSMHNDNLKHYK